MFYIGLILVLILTYIGSESKIQKGKKMQPQITYSQLVNAMKNGSLLCLDGSACNVQWIKREAGTDSECHTWVVHVIEAGSGRQKTIFVRTID